MHASTHALGFNAPADLGPPRSRQARDAGAAAAIADVDPGVLPTRATAEFVALRSHSDWARPRLARHVENALFAITLAAPVCMCLGAYPLRLF